MQKLVVGGIIFAFVTCGWGTMSVGEQVPAPRGEVRIVDKSPLNWMSITYNIFEHLMELDAEPLCQGGEDARDPGERIWHV